VTPEIKQAMITARGDSVSPSHLVEDVFSWESWGPAVSRSEVIFESPPCASFSRPLTDRKLRKLMGLP